MKDWWLSSASFVLSAFWCHIVNMASKKKGNYVCKSQVECMVCGEVIMHENKVKHVERKHEGDKKRLV